MTPAVKLLNYLLTSLLFFLPSPALAESYGSWGYNTEWYGRDDMHFSQPGLGNDFTLHDVRAHDYPGWNSRLLQRGFTVPQYNIRFGYFFQPGASWGVEFNFDHAKHIVTYDQAVHRTGRLNGAPVDDTVRLTADVLRYRLNNGANFLFLDLVRRVPLLGAAPHAGSVALLLKAGAGIMVPHTENSVLNVPNKPGFQFGGFGGGLETAIRYVPYGPVYFEFAQKGAFTAYRQVHINAGHARQAFLTYELIFSMGVMLGAG